MALLFERFLMSVRRIFSQWATQSCTQGPESFNTLRKMVEAAVLSLSVLSGLLSCLSNKGIVHDLIQVGAAFLFQQLECWVGQTWAGFSRVGPF